MKPIKILRLNRKHLSQMTYYFTSFQDNSCSHDGQSSICRIHSMQYIPVTPNMRDYNLLDSLGVAPDLERILDYAMLYGATYVELTGNDADIDPLLPTFKWTLDNDILYAILKDGEQMATYFAIGIDFPCHCIVPANFVLGSSDFSSCIEDTLRRIASLYPESTTAELYANMGAVPDEKIPEGEEDNWVPVDLGYSIPEILRIENSPKPPLYFKGKSLGSISGQLDSLIAYLEKHNPSLLERLKTSDSVEDAATAFLREYEKCKDLDREEIERVSAAKQIYEVFQEYQSPVE